MTKAEARTRLAELLAEMDERLYTNDDVRQIVEHIYAIASNISALLDRRPRDKQHATALGELLRDAAQSIKTKKLARRLRKLADHADDLEDYGDRSRYDELEDSEIEEADELRGALFDGLSEWLRPLGVEVE